MRTMTSPAPAPLQNRPKKAKMNPGVSLKLDRTWGQRQAVPNFSTLSRRQKTLKVNIPYRGSQGPLHLLIDIER